MPAPSHPFDLLAVLTPASATVWDRATSATSTAPDLATALDALSPRPRRSARVLVATGAFFTQRVALPAARCRFAGAIALPPDAP